VSAKDSGLTRQVKVLKGKLLDQEAEFTAEKGRLIAQINRLQAALAQRPVDLGELEGLRAALAARDAFLTELGYRPTGERIS